MLYTGKNKLQLLLSGLQKNPNHYYCTVITFRPDMVLVLEIKQVELTLPTKDRIEEAFKRKRAKNDEGQLAPKSGM